MAHVADQGTIVPEEYHYPPAYLMARRVISYIINLVELFLALRLVFQAFGANPGAGFTRFVYALTEPLVRPFAGIFPIFRSSNITVEWAGVTAMIVYALGAALVLEFLRIVALPPAGNH